MKIHDKLYIGLEDVGSGYVFNVSVLPNGCDEYIRKDALLEWAKEMQNSPLKNTTESADKHRLSKMIIDKISSL